MKRATHIATLSAALIAGGLLASPALADREIFTNWNKAAVYNWPVKLPRFTLHQSTRISYIDTYHWNNGQGSSWGQIRLVDDNGTVYGPWQAELRGGTGGARNVHWIVRPDVTLPPGTYTVQDTDWTTWAANAQSGWTGFSTVKAGEDQAAAPPPSYGGGDAAGRWRTSEGEMTLSGGGRYVTGHYTSDNGEIVGEMNGNVLEGYWIENHSSNRCSTPRNGRHFWGRIRFVIDGNRFNGQWSYCDSYSWGGGWTGERIGR